MSRRDHDASDEPSRHLTCRLGAEIALLLATVVTACGEQGATMVDLAVGSDPAWNVDRFQVRVDERIGISDPLPRLMLAIPDELAGKPTEIEVWGLGSGRQVAYGTTTVTPELHVTVPANLTLATASCGAWCPLGATRCHDDGVARCEQLASGCVAWSTPTPCTGPTPYCSNGACAETCADECADGAAICESEVTIRTCGEFDHDPCRDWSPSSTCGPGDTCGEGRCGSECSPERCTTPPQPTCDSSTVLRTFSGPGTCGAAGCEFPSTTTTCAGECRNGACVDVDPCANTEPTCAPVMVAIGDDANGVTHVAADAEYAYWANFGGHTVKRRRHNGGPIETFAANGDADNASWIVLDATHVYWNDQWNMVIKRKAKAGGPVEFFGAGGSTNQIINARVHPMVIALDDTHVYWYTRRFGPEKVVRRSKSGGPTETLYTGPSDFNFQGDPFAIAVDGTNVYWSNDPASTISDNVRFIPKTGGTNPSSFDVFHPLGMLSDGQHLYFSGGGVRRRPVTGGAITQFSTGGSATALALVDGKMYWSDSFANAVYRQPTTGTTSATLVQPGASGGAIGIAVSPGYVYWTIPTTSTVMKLPRCACGIQD